jgi:ribosomal protein S19
MARSLKKGPFADAHLLKKVDAMNAAGQHPAVPQSSRRWLDIQLQFMMAESMFRYMLPRIW